MNVSYHPHLVKTRCESEKQRRKEMQPLEQSEVLTPLAAWRFLNKWTRGSVSRATFYRWLSNGKIFYYRVGYHMYIPRPEIDDIIKQCQEGKWS